MKNILIVSSKSSDFGGLELHVLDLIKCFSKEHRVFVICPNGSLVEEYKKNGANVILKVPNSPADFSFAFYIKNFCKKNNINVIHAHELISAQGLLGGFLAGVPVRIWHVHTPFLMWQHKNFVIKIIKNTINFVVNFFISNFIATKVIALTPQIKNFIVKKEFVVSSKVVVIPNAVNTSFFKNLPNSNQIKIIKNKYNIPHSKIIIGNMSRTSAEKGQIYLLKAFNLLNKKYPNKFFLLLAGGGDLEQSFVKYSNTHFKGDYLITGKFKEEEKINLLSVMDLFVFPSIAEGFGYVLVEAMAANKVVISSDLPVLKHVGGEGVYYFKSKNFNDLYATIHKVVNEDPNQLKNKLNSNSNQILKFSLKSFKNNYSRVYGL